MDISKAIVCIAKHRNKNKLELIYITSTTTKIPPLKSKSADIYVPTLKHALKNTVNTIDDLGIAYINSHKPPQETHLSLKLCLSNSVYCIYFSLCQFLAVLEPTNWLSQVSIHAETWDAQWFKYYRYFKFEVSLRFEIF